MKQRPGDQPLPVRTRERDTQSLVIEDIRDRREVGIERYGTALQPMNGRNNLQDAYEEALDLAMYLKNQLRRDLKVLGLHYESDGLCSECLHVYPCRTVRVVRGEEIGE